MPYCFLACQQLSELSSMPKPAKGPHVCTGSHEWNDKVTSCPHTQATVPIQQAGSLQGLRSQSMQCYMWLFYCMMSCTSHLAIQQACKYYDHVEAPQNVCKLQFSRRLIQFRSYLLPSCSSGNISSSNLDIIVGGGTTQSLSFRNTIYFG